MEEIKRSRGRPKGSINKTETHKAIRQETEKLYRDIEHMLTPDQKEYFKMAFAGEAEFDSVKESELFLRFFSVYVTKLLSQEVSNPNENVLKDFGTILGQYNTAIKTLEEMKNKRTEMEIKQKNGNDGRMVATTRESALGRVQNILREHPIGETG